jgi:hypothetical protein
MPQVLRRHRHRADYTVARALADERCCRAGPPLRASSENRHLIPTLATGARPWWLYLASSPLSLGHMLAGDASATISVRPKVRTCGMCTNLRPICLSSCFSVCSCSYLFLFVHAVSSCSLVGHSIKLSCMLSIIDAIAKITRNIYIYIYIYINRLSSWRPNGLSLIFASVLAL